MDKKEVLAFIAGGILAVLLAVLLISSMAMFGRWVLVAFGFAALCFVGGLLGLSIYRDREWK